MDETKETIKDGSAETNSGADQTPGGVATDPEAAASTPDEGDGSGETNNPVGAGADAEASEVTDKTPDIRQQLIDVGVFGANIDTEQIDQFTQGMSEAELKTIIENLEKNQLERKQALITGCDLSGLLGMTGDLNEAQKAVLYRLNQEFMKLDLAELQKFATDRKIAQAQKRAEQELPDEVKTAKTPTEFYSALIKHETEINGVPMPEAEEKLATFKEDLAKLIVSLGISAVQDVGKFIDEGIRTSSAGEFISFLISTSYGGRDTGGRMGAENFVGKEVKTKSDFLDKIDKNPKKFGEFLKTARKKDKEIGELLPEELINTLVQNGDKESLEAIFIDSDKGLIKLLNEGDTAQKEKHWTLLRNALAQVMFDNEDAVFSGDVRDLLREIGKNIEENKGYDRYFVFTQ